MLNNYILNEYPVPEALEAMIEQRDGYHEKWDLAKEVTMEPFFEVYPQF
jgi:ABC-2 type transport system permease protein